MSEEVKTSTNTGDNQMDEQEVSLLGDVAAPSVQELDSKIRQNDNNEVSDNVTVNKEVSKTFGMEELLGMLDEDLRSKKTWEKFKSPADLAKSYTELEKMVGKKGDIPSDEDGPELWNDFWTKIGKPADPKGYELEIPDSLKQIEGVSEKVNKIKEYAHKANLSNDQAKALFSNLFEMEVGEVERAEHEFQQQMEQSKIKLKEAWGSGIEQMSNEVQALEKRLGVFEAFEESGLNNNADLLIALGKIAKDLKETSTIEMSIASTPQGLENEISELNAKAAEFIRAGKKVPQHIQTRLQEAFSKIG